MRPFLPDVRINPDGIVTWFREEPSAVEDDVICVDLGRSLFCAPIGSMLPIGSHVSRKSSGFDWWQRSEVHSLPDELSCLWSI